MQKRKPRSGGTVAGVVRRLNRPLLPSRKLQCFSVACLDMPHLEFGDKIVLPPKVLLELQCFKIPTPLLFKLRAVRQKPDPEPVQLGADAYEVQYCSVQEFSAPDGQVFLPYWLMQNLRVQEGGSVVVSSIVDVPRGIYCRLQPESTDFLDLAAEIGPKLLMETTLRRYSVLSENSTILVEHGVQRYYVRVVELKPAAVVSLCGDVDLETDFSAPEGFDPKRSSSSKAPQRTSANPQSVAISDPTLVSGTVGSRSSTEENLDEPSTIAISSFATGYGRRLRDGGYVADSPTDANGLDGELEMYRESKPSLSSLQQAQWRARDRQHTPISTAAVAAAAATSSSVLATHIRLAQPAFSTPGHTISTLTKRSAPLDVKKATCTTEEPVAKRCNTPEGMQRCSLCLAEVCSTKMELHSLRCAKNPVYHKFECEICHEKVLRAKQDAHQHCPACTCVLASSKELAKHQSQEHSASHRCHYCGSSFSRVELQQHLEQDRCDHVLVPCGLCGLSFKKKDAMVHERMCSSRTERCDVCSTYIRIGDFDAHTSECGVMPLESNASPAATPIETTTTPHAIECVYCSMGGFSSITAVEKHVSRDCRVARAFSKPLTPTESSNQERLETTVPNTTNANVGTMAKSVLVQGRMRRKEDTDVLRANAGFIADQTRQAPVISTKARRELEDASKAHLAASLPRPVPVPVPRPGQKREKMRKPKIRANPPLRALPGTGRDNAVKGLRTGGLTIGGVAADLRVPGTGLPLQPPRIGSRGRRKAAAALPPPGRLKKLP